MILTNKTKYAVDWVTGYQKDCREALTIIIKATYSLEAEPKLVEQQLPLVESDISSGDAGYSAILYETDYSPFKPYCDVLLNGCAYVPEGQFASQIGVSLEVSTSPKMRQL